MQRRTRRATGDDVASERRTGTPSLDSITRPAIEFHEGQESDEATLKALIRAAGTLNASLSEGAINRFQCRMPFVTQRASAN
jgi:hypothetical protein